MMSPLTTMALIHGSQTWGSSNSAGGGWWNKSTTWLTALKQKQQNNNQQTLSARWVSQSKPNKHMSHFLPVQMKSEHKDELKWFNWLQTSRCSECNVSIKTNETHKQRHCWCTLFTLLPSFPHGRVWDVCACMRASVAVKNQYCPTINHFFI